MKIPTLKNKAYTMVELMIAVGIIVVIAGIAVPAWERARESAQKAGLINELRNNSDAFQNYATDHYNSLPPTAPAFQQIPAGMASYMPQNSTWTTSPDGGGFWWFFNNSAQFPSLASYSGYICVYNCGLNTDQLQEIDSLLDDGNLNTGSFESSSGFIFYGIQ